MRFGLVHRIMTDALATLGILALIASGQFNKWVSGVILAGLVLALLVRESWQRHPAMRHLGTGAVLLLAAVEIGRVIFDTSALDVIIESAAGAQIIRLATRKGAAHDQQVIVLAFLHLIAGTVLGGGIGYGFCFFGVLIVAPGALVLSHLRREVEGNYRQGARDRTGLPVDVPRILRSRRVVGRSFLAVTCLLSIPIFCFTAVLFILFPRVGLSLLLLNRAPAGRIVGFTGHVDLGEVGVLRSDATLAMRVEIPGLKEYPQRYPLYLRGTALDAYDGRAWSQSDSTRRGTEAGSNWIIPIDGADVTEEQVMRIDLEPIEPPVIFVPPHATGMRFRARGQIGMDNGVLALRGPEGEFRYQPLDDRGLRYEIFLSPKRAQTFRRLPSAERGRYLTVPANLPARIRSLAEEWARPAQTPHDRARAIEQHLRTEYRYDLASPSGRDPQPLDHFLFESKRGHCEFYSTAMAIMLRTLNVPTRNVTGFVGGTYNRFGRFYAVRQGDAHSWVEVFLDEQGWVTFDPTPPADSAPKSDVDGFLARLRELLEATSQRWDQHVVRYDFNQQLSIVQRFTSRYKKTGTILPQGTSPVRVIVGFAFMAAGVGLAIWWFRRKRSHGLRAARGGEMRSPSASLAITLYETLDSAMTSQGIARGPSMPPLRHARNLAVQAHPLSREIIELTETYLEARFGGLALSEEQRRDFERRVSAIRHADLRAQRLASEQMA